MDYPERISRMLCNLEKRVSQIEISNAGNDVIYTSRQTYAAMMADGTPKQATIYEIMNDESQGNNPTMYIWFPSDNRYLIQTALDN